MFDNFEGILMDSVEKKWDTLTSGIDPAARDVSHFDQAIKDFYLKYCDGEAKDTMFKCLCLLHHTTKVEPRDHSNCIKTHMQYTNKLPGLLPDMNADQIKKIVFDQHPETWHKHYIRLGNAIQTDSLAEIFQFMSNKKGFADREEEKKWK
eukprot:2163053-Ditylum_brightwellii.AAC.1